MRVSPVCSTRTLDGDRGPGNCIWSQEFYETDASRGFVRGYTFEFSRGQGPVMAAVHGVQIGRLPWGEDHHRAYRRAVRSSHWHGGDLRGSAGRAQSRHARSGAEGLQRHSRAEDRLHAQREQPPHAGPRASPVPVRSCGLPARTTSWYEAPLADGGWHLMGTARMGTDPQRSVVNEWGRSHDVKNLFIVDGSIFVTSAGVNPTRTIQALALYVADNMKQRLATLFD